MSPFISQQMASRLQMMGNDYDQLATTIDSDCIPTKFGGNWKVENDEMSEQQIDEMCEKVVNYWKYYSVKK